jgi:hypothetical protein
LAALDEHQAVLVNVIPSDQILILECGRSRLRVEEFFHRGLVPLVNAAFQFITRRSETGAAQEMGHESKVFSRHAAASCLYQGITGVLSCMVGFSKDALLLMARSVERARWRVKPLLACRAGRRA